MGWVDQERELESIRAWFEARSLELAIFERPNGTWRAVVTAQDGTQGEAEYADGADQVDAARRARNRRSTRQLRFALSGVAQLAQTLALSLSPASDIALLSTASPLWIALLAWLWLGEQLGRRGIVGFGLAIIGLALILWPHDSGTTGAGQSWRTSVTTQATVSSSEMRPVFTVRSYCAGCSASAPKK